ncbi:MAG TPA: hypothetical protein VG714_06890 [Acidobacteriaceae bacterium]|nr:hypothetical protein [Acidobacteriaceae bacterium]
MRKILLLLLAVLVIWITLNRERIYVRDPMASVYLDNVKQSGFEVYINPSNDFLLRRGSDNHPDTYIVVQHWDKMPATPSGLTCLRWMVCLSSDEHVPTLPVQWKGPGKYDPKVTMDGHVITFVDTQGKLVRVQL